MAATRSRGVSTGEQSLDRFTEGDLWVDSARPVQSILDHPEIRGNRSDVDTSESHWIVALKERFDGLDGIPVVLGHGFLSPEALASG